MACPLDGLPLSFATQSSRFSSVLGSYLDSRTYSYPGTRRWDWQTSTYSFEYDISTLILRRQWAFDHEMKLFGLQAFALSRLRQSPIYGGSVEETDTNCGRRCGTRTKVMVKEMLSVAMHLHTRLYILILHKDYFGINSTGISSLLMLQKLALGKL